MRDASPLRYPGGKWRFFPFFEKLIELNFQGRPKYIEPFAGGGSLALSLLFSAKVSEIFLNDIDPAIYAFWQAVIDKNDEFCELVGSVNVTPLEWLKQREIYHRGACTEPLLFGFAAFFLNRTNHSGILNGGMIGGKAQKGEWKMDARFNREELIKRLRRIASFKEQIHLSCIDAMDLMRRHKRGNNKLIYLDPPYYGPGRHLYYCAYKPSDHVEVRDRISAVKCKWLVSYDDCAPIRELYRNFSCRRVLWRHTARISRQNNEIVYFAPNLTIPRISLGTSA